MPFVIGSGGSFSGNTVPSPFSYKVSADGERLELWQGGQMIATQSKDGSWFNDNISTGVGSLHLGGDYSGGLAHSVSSTGQNVGFKNEFSKAFPEDRMMFFPCWQGLSVDNDELIPPSYLSFSAKTSSTPNGSVHSSSVVDYNFTLTASTNFVTTKVAFWPAEDYTGKLRNVIISTINNVEIYSTSTDVVLNNGIVSSIDYQYPFFLRQSDNVRLQLIKEDGNYLRVRAGVTNSSQPWRELVIRTYNDEAILASNNLTISGNTLSPVTTDVFNFGSVGKSFRTIHTQNNIYVNSGVNEGNVDADTGVLGVYATTRLALGFGNKAQDVTISNEGVRLNKNMTVSNGNQIRFEDGDSANKEAVHLRMNGNNLAFYGVLNGVEDPNPIAQLTYDGTFTARNLGGNGGATRTFSVKEVLEYNVNKNIVVLNDDRVEIRFVGERDPSRTWFTIKNKQSTKIKVIGTDILGTNRCDIIRYTDVLPNDLVYVTGPTSGTGGGRVVKLYLSTNFTNGVTTEANMVEIEFAMYMEYTTEANALIKISGGFS